MSHDFAFKQQKFANKTVLNGYKSTVYLFCVFQGFKDDFVTLSLMRNLQDFGAPQPAVSVDQSQFSLKIKINIRRSEPIQISTRCKCIVY